MITEKLTPQINTRIRRANSVRGSASTDPVGRRSRVEPVEGLAEVTKGGVPRNDAAEGVEGVSGYERSYAVLVGCPRRFPGDPPGGGSRGTSGGVAGSSTQTDAGGGPGVPARPRRRVLRSFEDDQGRDWDVVVGRESWGALFAIFVPRGSGGEVRQAPLEATSHEAAARELDQMGEEGLRELLGRSRLKPLGE